MAKHTISGFVVWEKWHYEDVGAFKFQGYKPNSKSEHYDCILVSEHSIEVEVPDDFNPTPGLIASLEEQKRLLRLKLAEELMRWSI